MPYPHQRFLRRPVYVFSEDGAHTHTDKFRGMLKYAPLKSARVPDPNYLFIFREDERDFANRLYLALRNGIASFPGSGQFAGVSIGREQVDSLRLPPSSIEPGKEKELAELVYQDITKRAAKPDFVYVIGDQSWRYHRPSAYGAIKAALLRLGIPSQMVTKQLMQAEAQFRFAIPNIALSSLVKLGGVPWLIRRTDEAPALVIGVGTTRVGTTSVTPQQKYLGYAICMLSTGLFLDMSFFGVAASHEECLPQLRQGLARTLEQMEAGKHAVSKLTLHISHFERYTTRETIAEVLEGRKESQPTPIPFELLRLTHDSSFMVLDLDHPGYVAEEGVVVELTPRHSLVVMEGRQEKAKWIGRKPVTLEVHREYASSEAVPMLDSLRDAFQLGFVNWRGFGTKTKPASLAYAKLLSERVADIAAVESDVLDSLDRNPDFGNTLWFL